MNRSTKRSLRVHEKLLVKLTSSQDLADITVFFTSSCPCFPSFLLLSCCHCQQKSPILMTAADRYPTSPGHTCQVNFPLMNPVRPQLCLMNYLKLFIVHLLHYRCGAPREKQVTLKGEGKKWPVMIYSILSLQGQFHCCLGDFFSNFCSQKKVTSHQDIYRKSQMEFDRAFSNFSAI